MPSKTMIHGGAHDNVGCSKPCRRYLSIVFNQYKYSYHIAKSSDAMVDIYM